MLRKHSSFILFLVLALLLPFSGKAQNEISSPYSTFGVGILSNTTNGTMASMGGVSYAMQSPYYINYKNPASYIAFDSLSFIADASFSIVNSTLKTTALTQKGSYARANYLMIGLPVTKHWRTSIGIVPFSDIGYKIKDTQNEDITYSYDGDGGLIQLYWGNSFRICKGLSIGLNISYLFGSINNIRHAIFSNEYFLNTRIAQKTFLDGIYLSGGIQYFANINQNHRIGLGVVYENSAYIWARENMLISYYTGEYVENDYYDTVAYVVGAKGNMVVPQSVGGGITYSFKNKLLLGVDVTWQNWAKYRLMGRSDSLKNALITSFGVQYTPDPTSNKYMKRINIRAGGRYSSGYITLNDLPIKEFGVTFGLGFPIKTFTSQSTFNIMFEYGQMGSIKNDLILQNYFKVSLNFILQEKWYQRVRLE